MGKRDQESEQLVQRGYSSVKMWTQEQSSENKMIPRDCVMSIRMLQLMGALIRLYHHVWVIGATEW